MSPQHVQQRQQDLDLILRALSADTKTSHPSDVRQMVVQGLPHALGSAAAAGTKRHTYQAEFAGHAQTILSDIKQCAVEAEQAALENQAQAKRTYESATTAVEEASGVVQSARAAVAAKSQVANDADAALKDAQREQSAAEQNLRTITASLAQLRHDHAKATSIFEGPYRMLREGGWADDDMKVESAQAVEEHLNSLGTEEAALLSAAPLALQTRPCDRKAFDNMVIDTVGAVFEKAATELQQQLDKAEPSETQASAEALGFWSLADVFRDRARACAMELSEAELTVTQALGTHGVAEKQAAHAAAALAKCDAEHANCQAQTREMNEVLTAFDRLLEENLAAASGAVATETGDVDMVGTADNVASCGEVPNCSTKADGAGVILECQREQLGA